MSSAIAQFSGLHLWVVYLMLSVLAPLCFWWRGGLKLLNWNPLETPDYQSLILSLVVPSIKQVLLPFKQCSCPSRGSFAL